MNLFGNCFGVKPGTRRGAALALATILVGGREACAQAEPARASSVAELAADVDGAPIVSALGWVKFAAAGYRNAGEAFGTGAAADAELALGSAMEGEVKTLVGGMAGKKTKVRLNDAVEGTIAKVDDAGFTVTVGKTETVVPWADVDPGKLAIQLVKGKPTAEPALATISVLKLLSGDSADAKKQSGKLAGELGGKLKELLESWKEVGPEVAAARSLDAMLREQDPAKAVALFKSDWPNVKATKLGAAVASKAREQFLIRGEASLSGQAALDAAFKGTVRPNPAKAHPDAGPGGMGLELELEFEADAEGADFDPKLPRALETTFKRIAPGKDPPAPFQVAQSRAIGSNVLCGGTIPIEFGGDVEIELQGGISETASGDLKLLSFGLSTAAGEQFIALDNFQALTVIEDGKRGASMDKDLGEVRRGLAASATLKLGGGKLVFSRNGEEQTPKLNVAAKGLLRPFLLMTPGAQWYVERFVVRGTATRASLNALAKLVAEREATALFGS